MTQVWQISPSDPTDPRIPSRGCQATTWLLALYLDDKITDDYFAEQERTLTTKIDALERDHGEAQQVRKQKTILGQTFERVAEMVRAPGFNLNEVWDNASNKERRVMAEELIEAVTIFADRLEVTVTGAPPVLVRLDEVGLRDPVRDLWCRRGDVDSSEWEGTHFWLVVHGVSSSYVGRSFEITVPSNGRRRSGPTARGAPVRRRLDRLAGSAARARAFSSAIVARAWSTSRRTGRAICAG